MARRLGEPARYGVLQLDASGVQRRRRDRTPLAVAFV
jgi:hypothetical protein